MDEVERNPASPPTLLSLPREVLILLIERAADIDAESLEDSDDEDCDSDTLDSIGWRNSDLIVKLKNDGPVEPSLTTESSLMVTRRRHVPSHAGQMDIGAKREVAKQLRRSTGYFLEAALAVIRQDEPLRLREPAKVTEIDLDLLSDVTLFRLHRLLIQGSPEVDINWPPSPKPPAAESDQRPSLPSHTSSGSDGRPPSPLPNSGRKGASSISTATPTSCDTSDAPELASEVPAELLRSAAVHEEQSAYITHGLIEALYLTNKELHELTKPLFWRRVDFEGEPNRWLRNFEELNLAKYAQYIKELYLRQSVDDEERQWYDDDAGIADDYDRGFRSEFLIRCLEQIDDLQELDIDVPVLKKGSLRSPFLAKLLKSIARHTNLSSLTLTGSFAMNDDEIAAQVPQPWVARLLAHLPNLKMLSLQYLDSYGDDDELPLALAHLARLETLDITDSSLSTRWGDVRFNFALKALSLQSNDYSQVPPKAIERFIESFGDSLRCLTIDADCIRFPQETAWDMQPGETRSIPSLETLKLPKLRTLSVTLMNTSLDLLDRFTGCPIVTLDVADMSVDAWVWLDWIQERKFPELALLLLNEDYGDDADYPALLDACFEHSIQLRLQPSDVAEDDEMDADGMIDSDDSWVEDDDDGLVYADDIEQWGSGHGSGDEWTDDDDPMPSD